MNTKKYNDFEIINTCFNDHPKNELFELLYYGKWQSAGYDNKEKADIEFCKILASQTDDANQIISICNGSNLFEEYESDYINEVSEKALKESASIINKKDDPSKYFNKNSKFIPKLLADEIMAEYPLFTIEGGKEIYFYQDGVYQPRGEQFVKEIALQKLNNHYKKNYINETIGIVRILADVKHDEVNCGRYIVNLKNGLYDIKKKEFMEHTPDHLSTIQIPVTYDPEATCPMVDIFLSEVVDEEYRQVLIEWAAYALIPDYKIQRALLLYGAGSNGKSVYSELIKHFVGPSNTSAESLKRLSSDKHSSVNLYGKLLNISAETPKEKLNNDEFKRLVGETDIIEGDRKYQDRLYFQNKARLMFSTNHLPRETDDIAYARRWLLVPFQRKFEGRNRDSDLIYKLTTDKELSGLLNKALELLPSLLIKGDFSYNKEPQEVRRMFALDNDNISVFTEECLAESCENIHKDDLYDEYVGWCHNNNTSAKAKNAFGRKMKQLGYTDYREGSVDRQYYWEGLTVSLN